MRLRLYELLRLRLRNGLYHGRLLYWDSLSEDRLSRGLLLH